MENIFFRFSIGLVIVFFYLTVTECKKKEIDFSNDEIFIGNWFFISKSAEGNLSYSEMFFTRNRVWFYAGLFGTIDCKYKIKGDSLFFLGNYKELPFERYKILPETDSTFRLQSINSVVYQFHKFDGSVDTVRLFRGDDDYLDQYLTELNIRAENFLKVRN